MYLTLLLVSVIAAAAAAAAAVKRTATTAVADGSTPDCKAIKDYCTNCSDFQCETNPGCEWCYEHDGFGP